ncbi:hypothetical protein Lesp02_29340 [Lentzea sp. NBRC 105346]|uniref:hypothetical protein n=1 Tax=Lentzea sp. NBRC 105346 TaxID=3032205 RepID=UPI0024A3F87F|nr:hypothetical protein [Lentzea sp. NBRC 105346]GLZ30745.1 hypothetical protein Lesp02_29340 [Lentzea sp. NBRC 105346]
MTWLPVLTVVVGALIGFVPNYLIERRKERTLLRTRWDSPLFELCSEFTSTARRFLELCAKKSPDVDETHESLRTLCEQLRLLGSYDVQVAARWVIRHAFAVREVGEGREDPRAGEFPGQAPDVRMHEALNTLYVAARKQLRVASPDAVAPRELG